MIFSEEKKELTYHISQSFETALSWMVHLIRGMKQNEAKQHNMLMLDETTRLWLSDWVQIIISLSFIEGQNEYFGKKGMSLAIDVLFTKNIEDILQKKVYHIITYRCDQDVLDKLYVSQHVLIQIKKDLKFSNWRSDNAGYYSGNSVAEIVYNICKKMLV